MVLLTRQPSARYPSGGSGFHTTTGFVVTALQTSRYATGGANTGGAWGEGRYHSMGGWTYTLDLLLLLFR